MSLKGRFHFIHRCVGSTYEDIQEMLNEHPVKEISLRTFREAIGIQQWKELTRDLGYDRNFPISREDYVSYHSGTYRSVPAVWLVWSGFEYIFTLDGKLGPSAARPGTIYYEDEKGSIAPERP